MFIVKIYFTFVLSIVLSNIGGIYVHIMYTPGESLTDASWFAVQECWWV